MLLQTGRCRGVRAYQQTAVRSPGERGTTTQVPRRPVLNAFNACVNILSGGHTDIAAGKRLSDPIAERQVHIRHGRHNITWAFGMWSTSDLVYTSPPGPWRGDGRDWAFYHAKEGLVLRDGRNRNVVRRISDLLVSPCSKSTAWGILRDAARTKSIMEEFSRLVSIGTVQCDFSLDRPRDIIVDAPLTVNRFSAQLAELERIPLDTKRWSDKTEYIRNEWSPVRLDSHVMVPRGVNFSDNWDARREPSLHWVGTDYYHDVITRDDLEAAEVIVSGGAWHAPVYVLLPDLAFNEGSGLTINETASVQAECEGQAFHVVGRDRGVQLARVDGGKKIPGGVTTIRRARAGLGSHVRVANSAMEKCVVGALWRSYEEGSAYSPRPEDISREIDMPLDDVLLSLVTGQEGIPVPARGACY